MIAAKMLMSREANLLPAPKGPFLPLLRMYYPKETSPFDPEPKPADPVRGQGELTAAMFATRAHLGRATWATCALAIMVFVGVQPTFRCRR